MSRAAYRSGYMHVWNELDYRTKIWIQATHETIMTLEQIVDYISGKPDKD